MFCENCGNKIEIGHSFCMKCGTPIPENPFGDETYISDSLNRLGDTTEDEGTLVFCPNCGMHMQNSTDKCQICGMILVEKTQDNDRTSDVKSEADASSGGMGSIGGGKNETEKKAVAPAVEPPSDMPAVGGVEKSEPEKKAVAAAVESPSDMPAVGGVEKSETDKKAVATAVEPPSDMPVIGGVEKSEPEKKAVSPAAEQPSDMPAVGNVEKSETEKKAVAAAVEPIFDMITVGGAENVEKGNIQPENDSSNVFNNPEIPSPTAAEEHTVVNQKEPEQGKEREVENFSMSGGGEPISSKDVLVIEGGAMDGDSSNDIAPPDPYSFLNQNLGAAFDTPASQGSEQSISSVFPDPIELNMDPDKAEPIAPPTEPTTAPVNLSHELKSEKSSTDTQPVTVYDITDKPDNTMSADSVVIPNEKADISNAPDAPAKTALLVKTPEANVIPEDDFIPEGVGFIPEMKDAPDETALITNVIPEQANDLTQENSRTANKSDSSEPKVTPIQPVAPIKSQQESNSTPPENIAVPSAKTGNKTYCRNCGRDMLDTETVCKYCGSPVGAIIDPVPTQQNNNNDKKKIFGIFPVPVFAGIAAAVVAVIALGVFIAVRAANQKAPIDSDYTANVGNYSSDANSSDTASDTASDISNGESVTNSASSNDDTSKSSSPITIVTPSSSVPESSSEPDGTSSSISSSSAATSKSSSATASKSSSAATSKSSSSSQTPAISAKVQSLEQDRVKLMNAAAALAGEMGKIELLANNVSYEYSKATFTRATTLKNYFNSALGKALVTSIQNGNASALATVNTAKPQNSELNSLYSTLQTLKQNYLDCYNSSYSQSDPENYVTIMTAYINAFNKTLASMGFNKFMTSSYTTANREEAYASILKLTYTGMNEAANKLTDIHNAVNALGEKSFNNAYATVGSNSGAYINAAVAMGKVNAYRLMLSGVSNKYSGSYPNITSAYTSMNDTFTLFMKVKTYQYNEYSRSASSYLANIKSCAARINSAV